MVPLHTFCPNCLKSQAAGVTCSCFGSAFKRLRMQAKTRLICAVRFCFRHRISMWLSSIDSVCSSMGGQSCPEIRALFGRYRCMYIYIYRINMLLQDHTRERERDRVTLQNEKSRNNMIKCFIAIIRFLPRWHMSGNQNCFSQVGSLLPQFYIQKDVQYPSSHKHNNTRGR